MAVTPKDGGQKVLLQVQNMTKQFGGLTAVRDVNFKLARGEIIGLIGANGAGKTTLFNCITGFLKVNNGTITFEDENITDIEPFRLPRLGISRTFQVVRPFGRMTVKQNVIVGAFCQERNPARAQREAEEVLERVGLYHRKDDLAKELTIGDRKRLELARALATKPKLLLLDEVMGGLRPNEVNDMLELLRKINESCTALLVIEHIMHAIMSISQRIIVLHHGEKIAEGLPREVANNHAVIDAYLGGSESLA